MSSIATYIRDAIFARLTTSAFSWKSTRKTPLPTLQIGAVPALGVFLLRESYAADGDANVGPPRYIVDAQFSVMVLDLASKPDVLEGSVDTLVDTILDTLLQDPTFFGLKWTDGVSPVIDSIPAISRTYNFPQSGDTYYLECRLQITIRYFCFFDPTAPNDLLEVAVTPQPSPLATPGVMTINLPGA